MGTYPSNMSVIYVLMPEKQLTSAMLWMTEVYNFQSVTRSIQATFLEVLRIIHLQFQAFAFWTLQGMHLGHMGALNI